MRHGVVFFCIWVSSLLAVLAQEQTVFRAGVDGVVVDVTVVDADGNPNPGLTPQDFVILVDGKPRRVASLEYISRERTVATEEPVEAPPEKTTHFSTNEGAQPGRLVVIVVDRQSIRRGGGRVAMTATARFVDNLGPRDRVGLYTMPPGGPSVDFTFDHERIKEALGGIAGVAERYAYTVGFWNVGMTEAMAIHRGDRFIQAEVFNRECWDPITKQMDPLCLREVALQSRRMVDQARLDARNSIIWMLEIVNALAYIEEPKTIVLVSEGFLQDQETYRHFQTFARVAARARVNLYAVHFDTLMMDASLSKASPTLTEDIDLQSDGLANLAGMSGGAMFRATEGSVPLDSLPPDVYLARTIVSKSGTRITNLTRPFRLEQSVATETTTQLEALPEGPARSYARIIDHYQKGQTIGAISTLNRMAGSDIAKALEVIEGIGLSDEKSKAAALLHTEVALAGNDEVYHLEVARGMAARIEDVDARVAFQMRWLRAVGLHFWNLNRAEDALVYLEQANDLDPTDVETVIAIASIYETIGWVAKGGESLERAESVIGMALKDDAENVEARLRLGHVLKIQGRRDDALEELHWVLEATDDPNLTMIAHLLIGDLLKDKDLIDEAIESYKKSVDLDPLCQVAVTALSQALHRRGELEASRAVIDAFFHRKDTFVGKHDGWRRYLHGYPERSQALLAELREEIR